MRGNQKDIKAKRSMHVSTVENGCEILLAKKFLVENILWEILGKSFEQMPHLISLRALLLTNIAYIGSLSVCLCLFASICLGHCHHQMTSFQKIYGLYSLKHHTMEINGDVIMVTTNK